MDTEPSSAELLAQWQAGDAHAAEILFERYFLRLVALARAQLGGRLASRVDPEDVVQSAFRSFFTGARAGRYALERSGDLWRLLAAITRHKVLGQVDRQTAAKRSIQREQQFGTESSLFALHGEALTRDPAPDEAAALIDEIAAMLRPLEPRHRQMVEMRLQGFPLAEIAAATDRSERMVRVVLQQVKTWLQQRCAAAAAG
jgi:RNA polymerase sigma-70 factor (ECF subfamily)